MKNEESTDVPVRQDATGPKLKLQATGREGRSRTSFRPPLKMGTCVFFGATALLLSFFVVIMFSMLCLSLRRYKWHPVIYITAIATYLYFLPRFYAGGFFLRDRRRKLRAVFLWAPSCYLY